MNILAFLTAFVFLLLGLLHVYWALGGKRFGKNAVPYKENGRPVFQPGKMPTLVVAAGLWLFAAVVIGNTGIYAETIPRSVIYITTIIVAVVFSLRTIGEFRYVGLFRRIRTTDFARKDTWIYTPLCLLIAIACWMIHFLTT